MILDATLSDRIKQEIAQNPVILFMKGSPAFPQSGPCAAAVQALTLLEVHFHSVDVLEDPALRDGIKLFTPWPTLPQLFVNGQFAGDGNILRDSYENGSLAIFLREHGIACRQK